MAIQFLSLDHSNALLSRIVNNIMMKGSILCSINLLVPFNLYIYGALAPVNCCKKSQKITDGIEWFVDRGRLLICNPNYGDRILRISANSQFGI